MTKETYSVEVARTILPELLERAHQGSTSVIAKQGKPYAALVPVRKILRARRLVLSLRGTGKGLWSKYSAQTLRVLRDEWQ